MFGVTARDADFSGADLTKAKPIGDFKGANLSGATLVDLRGGADIRNQSMGLMRTVFTSVNLSGANLKGADLGRSRLEYANLRDADLTNVVPYGAASCRHSSSSWPATSRTGASCTAGDWR